ncbi:MAG: Unknown protein [uncultured Campylobacterales bacterium]|uniref:YlxR domain-containing protein n=1 Tax=uncultured Campylobacterales bacterium TaxID=352960 RepID=A0A6S6SB36_9BACT|nr:MAG: Unknown protein [uncultured Campylobacterales bacterium]
MNSPIRMCISCRNRLIQKSLYRFSVQNEKLILNNKNGRSLYLCQSCLLDKKKEKKINNILENKFKVKEFKETLYLLKEKLVNV